MKSESIVQPAASMVRDGAIGWLIQLIGQVGDDDEIDIGEVRTLLDAGTSPDTHDENGVTLRHRVVEMKDSKMIVLLACGANPDLINKDSSMPFDLAEEIDDGKIIDILQKKGAKTTEELKREKKKLKQFQSLRGRRKSRNFGRESESRSEVEPQFGDVKFEENGSDWHANSPKTLWFDSQKWQDRGQKDGRNSISEQKVQTCYDQQWKTPKLKTQTRAPTQGQVQGKSTQACQGRAILRVNQTAKLQRTIRSNTNSKLFAMGEMERIATFWRLLRRVLQSECVSGDRKVFTLSRSSKRDWYCLGRIDTQRQQSKPLDFATRKSRYYDKKECRTHFDSVSLSIPKSSDRKIFTLPYLSKKDGYYLGKVST
ncbi:MAG: hypothetical protein LBF34_00100 [Puniceicoccales bacterium]|nr:hypothetical protein [Puniceicoccales bacterium]